MAYSAYLVGNAIDSTAWAVAPSVTFRDTLVSDNTVVMRSLWTNDTLYFRFDVTDTRLWATCTENDSRELWKDDIVEFLLDPQNHHAPGWTTDDLIYHFNLLGHIKDDRGCADGTSDATWNTAGRYSVSVRGTVCDDSDIDDGYTVLVALPWSEIGLVPASGLEMGYTFGCDDRDSALSEPTHLFIWTHAKPTRSPEQFGVLSLTKRK